MGAQQVHRDPTARSHFGMDWLSTLQIQKRPSRNTQSPHRASHTVPANGTSPAVELSPIVSAMSQARDATM